ncbi:unnamed protein product [Dicrocoelium dendriticum]|nr:unnamed protein product [Dicrocoelium dendriticum]
MSHKKIPLLRLQPEKELFFKGPFTDVVVAKLNIKNDQTFDMCFKVSLTRPEQYYTRYTRWTIFSTHLATIDVALLPFEYEPMVESNDEIIIQCIVKPVDKENDQVLASVEKMDSMLKCIFKAPGLSASAVLEPNGGAT